MRLNAQGNRVLVELIPYDLKRDGIELLDSHKEVQQTARVVGVGAGYRVSTGAIVKPVVEIGDEVIIEQTAGTKVKDGDNEYMIVSPENIIGGVE